MASITVSFQEESGSPSNEVADFMGGFKAVRRLRCAWRDRIKLANQLRGYTAGVFSEPATYPDVSGAYVQTVAIEPAGDRVTNSSGLPDYEWAILTVEYEQAAIESNEDGVWAKDSFSPAAEFMTRDQTDLYWASDGTDPVKKIEAPGVIIRMTEWVIVQHNMQYVPVELNDYIGFVNSIQLISASTGRVFEPETILFNGAAQEQQWTQDGPSGWTVTYAFLVRQNNQPWNKFFKSADDKEPSEIYGPVPSAPIGAAGPRWEPYQSADFLDIFGLIQG